MTGKIRTAIAIFVERPLVLLISIVFAIFMFLNHVVTYYWPVYMVSNFGIAKMSPAWMGLIVMSIFTSVVGSRMLSGRIQGEGHEHRAKLERWYVFGNIAVTLPVFLLAALSFLHQKSLATLILTIGLLKWGLGFIRPCFETLVNDYLPAEYSKQRATVLSFINLVAGLACVLLMVPSGGPSGQHTAQGWVIPAVLLVVATAAAFWKLRSSKSGAGVAAMEKTGTP